MNNLLLAPNFGGLVVVILQRKLLKVPMGENSSDTVVTFNDLVAVG